MDERVSRWLPERLIAEKLEGKVPNWIRYLLSLVVLAAAWAGILSFLANIGWVVDAVVWLYDHSGVLTPIVKFIGWSFHLVISFWRELTEPVRVLIFGWLPFEVPRLVFDLLFVILVFLGAYLKAWFATRRERRLMAVFSGVRVPYFRFSNFNPEGELTQTGKIALIKRVMASIDILEKGDRPKVLDKAEQEFVFAMDEMTSGITDKEFTIVEEALSLPPDEMYKFLVECASADIETALKCRKIVFRGALLSAVMAACLLIDLGYRHLVLGG